MHSSTMLKLDTTKQYTFQNSFIETQFTYHEIYQLMVYNSMIFSISQSCASITTIDFRTFLLLQKETPHPLAITLQFPIPPSALDNH